MRLTTQDYQDALRPHFSGSRLWMLPIGLGLATLAQILAVIVLFPLVAMIAFSDMPTEQAIARISALGSRPALYAFFATFTGPLLATALWARWVHKIPFARLLGVSRGLILRDFLAGVSVILVVAGAGIVAALQFQLFLPNIPFLAWLPWLVPTMAFIFVQVFAEELVFRGYLQPALAARFRSPVIWLILPALLFGALHWQPGTFGSNAPLVVAAATLMGIVTGHVTARTGNISAALGLHFMNNCVGMLLVAVQGDLSVLSLYLHPVTPSDEILMRGVLIGNFATIIGAYGIYLWVLKRRDARLKNQSDTLMKTFN